MLLKKSVNFMGLLVILGGATFVGQAIAALTISDPIAASDALVASTIADIETSADLVDMRNEVRTDRMISQSTIYPDNPLGEQLPMQSIMIPLMQEAIMMPMMESLSNVYNGDGLVYVFAPTFEGEASVPVIPEPTP